MGQILVKSFSGSVPGELFTRIIRGAFCKTSKIEFKRALKESETVVLWATSYSRALPEPRVFTGFGRDDGGEYVRFFCPKDPNNRVTYLHLRDIVVYESAVISFDDGEEIDGRFFCVECSEFLEFLGEKGYILYQVISKEEDKVSA